VFLDGADGLWALKQCCRQGRDWVYQGLPIFNIAVNVSALQLLNARFSINVLDIISKSHFPPTLLELTESSMVRDPDAAEKLMKNLSSIGVKISIDDFGTGYSSYPILRSLLRYKSRKLIKVLSTLSLKVKKTWWPTQSSIWLNH
jgi:EAL domain-containing protein (putative c-di-GMP-specific phosphodiesterase class I)